MTTPEEQAELIRLRQVVEDKHKAMNQAEDEWESAYQALRRYRIGIVRQRLMQEEGSGQSEKPGPNPSECLHRWCRDPEGSVLQHCSRCGAIKGRAT